MIQGAVGRIAGLLSASALVLALFAAPASGAGPSQDATCPPLGGGNYVYQGVNRLAQTFTAGVSGKLTSAQINVTKNVPDPQGDWVMAILAVDGVGTPANTALASTVIPYSTIPGGSINTPLIGSFSAPPAVSAGGTYALMITRPPAGANGLRVQGRAGGCPGSLFSSPSQTDPFTDTSADLVFTTFVDGSPPLITLTKRPKKKTGSDRAKFKFTADEAVASFRCSLDKSKFKPCSSPRTYKNLDEGRHRFRVEATDGAGNVAAPTRFKWKVL